MMKVQESMFRNLFESLLSSINNRVDGVIKDLKELKSRLQFTQKDVADLRQVTEQMWQRLKKSLKNCKVK